jgi:hypothetical protein
MCGNLSDFVDDVSFNAISYSLNWRPRGSIRIERLNLRDEERMG